MGDQRVRKLGRTLRNVELACIEPRRVEYTPSHALYHLEAIGSCFGTPASGVAPSVSAILAALESGTSEWHEQAALCLSRASPLALTLSLSALRAAEAAICWSEALREEAGLCAAAAASVDCAEGARALEATKRYALEDARAAASAAMDGWDDDGEEGGMAEGGEGGGERADGAGADAAGANEAGADEPPPLPFAWEHRNLEQVSELLARSYLEGRTP